ncbi:MAG: membrane protein insertase YidC [Candidatus Amulumruptor caecigallinarius]|nr:membrane protein insertase YidC [Candidatus Amulumruptor caecigallinarius]MCM1396247.1 membrane protein insertase YidC [Candidatus Amulumruptor caecigallinarius]MCM1454299.1 membrane protein insertase YidC [bacterium]
MNKNTMLGMLFMVAIIMAFMWLNKPSEEELRQQRELAEQQARDEQAKAAQGTVLTVDSVSPDEIADLRATVRQYGQLDSVSDVYTLHASNSTISVSGDGSISGSVKAAGTSVPMADIINHHSDNINRATRAAAITALKADLDGVSRYQGFARYLSGDSTTVKLANNDITLELSNKGGIIARATLNHYDAYDSTAVELMAPHRDGYSFTLTSATRRYDTSEFFFKPVVESDTTVLMQLDLGGGAVFGLRYTLPAEGYLVKLDVVQEGMQGIIPPSVASMDLNWHSMMERTEAGRVFEEQKSGLYYQLAGGDVDDLSSSGDDSEALNQRVKWIGCKNQFFSSVLIARTNFTSADLSSVELKNDPNFIKRMDVKTTLEYSSTLANPASFTFFLGPNSYPLLKGLEKEVSPGDNLHLTKLIPLGWSLFRWINTLIIIPVFTFLGHYISNYGIIILLLTIFIKLILFPFTYKSYMSQAKMRVLQPEIKAINEKWPGQENAMKRQQETMALYSRAGASPFSGCLPMLLQLPILFAMFQFFPSAIELRGEPFLWAKDLSAPDAIVSWTTNIPLISSTFGNHISLFCLLMTVTNIIYTKLNMQSQPTGDSMPGMKWMMYLMPVMFLVFFNNYASGLSYYYFVSLLITIIQTYIFRQVVNEEKVRATLAANAAKNKGKKKSGFMARLEEAQRRQQAMMREQQKKQGNRR